MPQKPTLWKNLPGPESIQRVCLPNGITLLSYPNPHVSSVNIIGLMEGGSALDPQEKLGLAHFAAGMLSRGTDKRDFKAYHRELEERGASLSFSSGANHTWFRGNALGEDLQLLLELAAESLRQPAFPAEYLERFRAQLLAGLSIRDQDTGENASLIFDQKLFPNHPYGQPEDGFSETIRNIQREDLLQFQQDYYAPQGLMLAVVGAIQPGQVEALVNDYLGRWQNPGRRSIQIPPTPAGPDRIIRKHKFVDEKSQVDLILGCYAPERTSADFETVKLGNNILGQFGLMGRIGESVRSRSGLAYYASSSISSWGDGGTWEFSAGCNPENVEKTIDLIRAEIKRFVNEPVKPQELDDSRSHLVGRLPLSLESNAGLANAMLSMERFQLGLDYYQRYAQIMQGISREDILSAAKKYLHPDQLVIASAGPGCDIL